MNTLKIECSNDDYFIATCTEKSENEIIVELPEDWYCDYVNAVLWEDDICEMSENGDEHILLIPNCGELLLEGVKEDDKRKYIFIPVRYENLEILIIKI
ncbi:hypothetical protein [uncultured Methanobrevibacter sp.]|uniref:hypothetical protein n=1 Tax=uncultured Methanobrevibacter sp. TaxID=253161 RepID=UPI0025ECCDE0|nr:hypothetical protein [uncultured Methanobrevibacter sp.]